MERRGASKVPASAVVGRLALLPGGPRGGLPTGREV